MAGTRTLRIAWLTTGRGPGSFGALKFALDAIGQGLPVEIAVAFVNRSRGEAEATDRLLSLVEEAGVPAETLSSVAFRKANGGTVSKPGEPLQEWRFAYDRQVADRLGKYNFELAVMFGYMLIATEPLFGRYPILNDHPALPDGPVGTYQEVIRELIRTQAHESGCMMNLVTGDVDRGPAVSFCRFPIRDLANESLWSNCDGTDPRPDEGNPLFDDIRRRGVRRERPLVVETLRAIATGELSLPPAVPLDLTGVVESLL